MKQIIWSALARRDVLAIATFYGKIDPDLSRRMLTLVEAAPLPLVDHPALGTVTTRRETRKWAARGTPFLLFYGFNDTRIEIKRVHHAAENWRKAER